MDFGIAARMAVVSALVAPAFYVHFRGRERLSLRRQITDHSTFLAPYNVLVYFFSAVPRTPLLDVEQFEELRPLRDNWRTIREEALHLYEVGHIRASGAYDDLGFNTFFKKGWKRFYLKWYGAPLPSAQQLCPKTVALLNTLPTVHGAMFALIGPNGKVNNHRDPFAGSLRYHLGLVTPNSDECHMHIDGNFYSWRDGKDLVFDETFIHRFENRTDQDRIILFCDFERPIRNPVMRAVNRFAIRHVVGMTATKNMEGERIGLANRLFHYVYSASLPVKRFKTWNRRLYYALKYALMITALGLFLFAGSLALL
jgi:beta-hydroxylase